MADTNDKFDFSENPFVGPHPIETGRNIFGRNREIDDLYYLLSAERIVMLHSPSGAGKTSLIQAGLIPRLKERFDVWGPTRVSQLPSANSSATVNRYIRSAVLGFEQQIPAEGRHTEEQFAEITLADYVASRREESKNIVLIFDQFEEILTADPLAIDAKREFFKQLGELLLDPRIWALFAMREDYLPALDPYVEQVPTHLKNWFRLDLLRRDKATEAMTETAKEGGRQFDQEAVTELVTDLATMKVQQPDGSFASQKGLYVEPLQLQVVCRRLWEQMPENKETIDRAEIEQSGDVTNALADYYAAEVARLADGDVRIERNLREWVGERLITPDGIRSQVLRGAGNSEGLDNALVASLVNTHLVRGEQREGATWYELAHDRLIEPIRNNNRDWFDTHLHRVQKLASLWEREGHPDGLLLTGEELPEARLWAKENDIWLTPNEFRFLEASVAKQKAIEKEERHAKRMRKLLVTLAVVALLALGAAGYALISYLESRYQRSIAQYQEVNAVENQREAEKSARQAFLQKTLAGVKQTEAEAAKLAEEFQKELVQDRDKDLQKSLADSRGLLYVANQFLAWNAFDQKDFLRTNDFLEASIPDPKTNKKEDARSFDWYYLWRQMHNEKQSLENNFYLIKSMSFSPNGQILAIADRTNVVSLLDVTSGKKLQPIKSSGGGVNSIAFSPNGLLLAAGCSDHTVRLWNVASGEELYRMDGHTWVVTSVLFSPDGQTLASGSGDATVRLWNVRNGKALRELEGHTAIVASLSFSPDSKTLSSWSGDRTLKTWDVVSGKTLRKLTEIAPPVSFSPDGRTFACGSQNSTVKLWDILTGKEIRELKGHRNNVLSLSFSPDGRKLASGSYDKTVKLWDVVSGQELIEFKGHMYDVELIAYSPDSRTIASFGGDIRLWEVGSGKEFQELKGHASLVSSVAFSRDSRTLASGSFDQNINLWDVVNNKKLRELKGHTGESRTGELNISVTFSPDGRVLASGGADKALIFWDVESGKKLRFLKEQTVIASLSFSEDSRMLASGGLDKVVIWDVVSGKKLREIKSQLGIVFSVMFSPDMRTLVTGSQYGGVKFWNVINGTELQSLREFSGDPYSVAFSPDGQLLAAVNFNHIKLWDMGTRKILWELKAHTEIVASLAFSPDGRMLASGSHDRTVKLWDVRSGKELRKLEGHRGFVRSLSFSPDGRTLVSGGGDSGPGMFSERAFGEILVWRGATDDEVKRQCLSCALKWNKNKKKAQTFKGSLL